MTKPANPAIIIGLGGTGQWVLTYVKKNLVDTYGEVPSTVRLLSFDTTSDKTEAKVEKGEEHARVGNVQLEAGEFVYVGGNIKRICEEIKREGMHNQIASWLQADYYLTTLDDDAFELSKGAGQRRPFGRMSIYYDLIQNPSKIIGKIEQAITDVTSNNAKRQPIEIYIVCSLAGGTGSGMVIDMAHITRQLAERKQVPFAIRAFLVLQNTFGPVMEINKILENAFAATRELDRFLQVFDRDYPIYYSDDRSQRTPTEVYRSIYKSKLFDNCYLLDARRANQPLENIKPWLGMFPAVAECISALLDSETGDTFAQHYKNVNQRLALSQATQKQALYSSLGTYTYILPVQDMIESAIHRAAVELLRERLFKITEDEHTRARKITTESQREYRDEPREAVKAWLKADKTSDGSPNILFLQQMAATIDGGNLNDAGYIQGMATRGLDLLSWLSPVEKDDNVTQASNTIQAVVDASMVAEILTSEVEKDDYVTAAARISRKVKEFRDEKLGYEDAGNRRVPGKLQKGLAEYALLNRRRCRKNMADLINTILNGEHSDPAIARGGKLPYAQEMLAWLLKMLDDFDAFMKRVADYRSKNGEMTQARDSAVFTHQAMEDSKTLTGIFDKLKKTAIHGQEEYIASEDYLFQLEREEVLYRALMDYTAMFRTITEDAKSRLDQWAQILTLGGPVGSNEPGAYNLLINREAQLNRRRDEQKNIKVYEYLTDEQYEDELYKKLVNGKWPEILRRFKWEVSFQHADNSLTEIAEEGQVRYRFTWEKAKENDFTLRFYYGDQPLASEKNYQISASEINATLLVDKLRPYFIDIRDETIADRIMRTRRADGLAVNMLNNTGALISFEPTKQPVLERHNFICVNRGVQVNYFDELAGSLKVEAPHAQDNQVIGLTNKHRCVVLSTLDLIIGQETEPIIASRKAYLDFNGDHRLLHNFPAEINAIAFEQRMRKPPIQETRRLLSPTLVALLEDRDMARRYIFSRVFGLIREEPNFQNPKLSQFTLTIDRKGRRDSAYRIALTQPQSNPPKELDAMTEFVFVEVDRESGARTIKDITFGAEVHIDPKAVDDALEIRRKAIRTGRESMVQEFEKMLTQNASLLSVKIPNSKAVLVNAFRVFLMTEYDRYDRDIRLGNTSSLKEYITTFMENNRDCLAVNVDNNAENEVLFNNLTDCTVDVVNRCMEKVKPGKNAALVNMMEQYIDQRLIPLRKSSDSDQLTKDLGAIFQLMLWDEINNLERMTDTDF